MDLSKLSSQKKVGYPVVRVKWCAGCSGGSGNGGGEASGKRRCRWGKKEEKKLQTASAVQSTTVLGRRRLSGLCAVQLCNSQLTLRFPSCCCNHSFCSSWFAPGQCGCSNVVAEIAKKRENCKSETSAVFSLCYPLPTATATTG